MRLTLPGHAPFLSGSAPTSHHRVKVKLPKLLQIPRPPAPPRFPRTQLTYKVPPMPTCSTLTLLATPPHTRTRTHTRYLTFQTPPIPLIPSCTTSFRASWTGYPGRTDAFSGTTGA